MSNIERIIYPILPTKFKEILANWYGRKITDEFYIEICEVACRIPECINDFRWHPLPTATQEYKKWKFMHDDEKKDFIAKNYKFYIGHIKDFGESVDKMKHFNDRNKKELQDWLKLKISEESRRKIEQVLDTHSGK